ncbi:MAG: hypothetical protein WCE30_23810 [Mycobacterium sp.]
MTISNSSRLSALYDQWTRPNYVLRVRGATPMFLWGSAGITVDLKFDKPLLVHVRNDAFGEVITLGTRSAGGTEKSIGTLQPGECVSLPVQDLSGVFATCVLESDVAVIITGI